MVRDCALVSMLAVCDRPPPEYSETRPQNDCSVRPDQATTGSRRPAGAYRQLWGSEPGGRSTQVSFGLEHAMNARSCSRERVLTTARTCEEAGGPSLYRLKIEPSSLRRPPRRPSNGADTVMLTADQIARLDNLTPAAGERHNDAQMRLLER